MEQFGYFYEPIQVRFFCPTDEEPKWEYGIAFRDEIICGCCGGVFSLEDVYYDAEQYGIPVEQAIKTYGLWIDFSEYIGEL